MRMLVAGRRARLGAHRNLTMDEQRLYPWGAAAPGTTASLAVFDCLYPTASGNCSGVTNVAPVGSATGNTKWGHADLAGNLWEWTVDEYGSSYSNPCNNCASLGAVGSRVVRGGTYNYGQSYMRSTFRFNSSASFTHHEYGVRCARKP
jgi:formylglycine-generating enzyme